MSVWDAVLTGLLIAVCLGSAILTVFQLPGTWIVLAAAAGYAWYGEWARIGWRTLAVLAAVAIAAELAETASSFWLAKRGGGSRRAAWWGLLGGLAGAFLLTIPVPIVGTLIGAAAGCFGGALAAELSLDRRTFDGVRIGLYSAIGRIFGTVLKIAAATAMAAITIAALIW